MLVILTISLSNYGMRLYFRDGLPSVCFFHVLAFHCSPTLCLLSLHQSTSPSLSGTSHLHVLYASRFSLGVVINGDKNVKKSHSLTRNRLTRFY